MDQVVVDCGPDGGVGVGDRPVLLGPGGDGEPTAQDWADELGTIHIRGGDGVHLRRVHRTLVDPSAPTPPGEPS
jgi:alanine racemase